MTLDLRKLCLKARRLWFFALSLVFFLSLGACTSNPFGSHDSSNHAAGAALGGAAAGLGTAALGAPRPLVISATVGGMALGYYASTLRFDAGPIYKVGGEVYSQGEYVGINIPSYKLFDTNTAELLPQAEPVLDSVVAVLRRYPDSNILISGNTSGMGSHRYDQKLAEARARQVAAYLWAHGVSSFKNQSITTRKLAFVGYGDYFPIANAIKVDNIQKNSRIQITAYPSKADLQLDKNYKVFTNVGSNSDPAVEDL